jgi:hypothetical protein
MNYAYLKYGFLALPALADRDGEVNAHWSNGGNHVITASATYKHAGTNSFKIANSGGGDFSTNFASLASGYNAAFTVGRKYCIPIWLYSAADTNTVQIKTADATSSVFTVVVGTWTLFHFVFTAVTSVTTIQIANVTQAAGHEIWFELEQVCECVDLPILIEKGMSDPDIVEFFPAIQYTHIDGTMKDVIKGFRRLPMFDSNVVLTSMDRRQILYWLIDTTKQIDYLTEYNVPMCLADIGGFENKWLFDCSLMRAFTINLKEPSIRTTFPV